MEGATPGGTGRLVVAREARGGGVAPVILALGAVTGGVGANLIAGQLERWKDRAHRAGEAEVAAWIDERVTWDANLRNAIDDILERLQAVQAAQAELGEAERHPFTEALPADLDRLGNLPRFQATLSGSGAIAPGDRSVAAGAGGVAVGGDIRGSVVTAGDVFEVISRLPPGTRAKDDIDKEVKEERQSWGTR
jgi:hypothetical protein